MRYGVREATAVDGAAIGEAHGEAWRVAYRPLFTEPFLWDAIGERRTRWRQLLIDGIDGVLLVVEHESAGVVGFHHAGPSDDQRFDAEVYGFYLHPEHWGSGAASLLMREGLEQQQQTGAVMCHLWSHAGGERARAFYERSGWRATGRTRLHDFGDVRPAPLVEYATPL